MKNKRPRKPKEKVRVGSSVDKPNTASHKYINDNGVWKKVEL